MLKGAKMFNKMIFILLLIASIHSKEHEMKDFSDVGFTHKHEFSGSYNDDFIKLTRFTKVDEISLFGEHISFVKNKNGTLIAVAKMLKKYANKPNLSKDEAKNIALSFLEKHANDLLENYKILWIDLHDEIINDGAKTKISGLKVKCQNLNDKKYFWVIVGFDKSIMVFERDVIWDFLKAGRVSEKYIHDSWLEKFIKSES